MPQFSKNFFYVLLAGVVFLVAIFLFLQAPPEKTSRSFSFGTGGEKKSVLEEAGSMKKSSQPDWWLNSGGLLDIQPEYFSTNLGALAENSFWQKLYKKNNPVDTDDGYYPQNIFRLVTRSQWQDFSQTLYFFIVNDNLSPSPQRNESNGVLLFNRYQDGDNLYYAGVRVDGDAVIKKKIDGKYYTLAEKHFFEGQYDKEKNPDLIPKRTWLGIKAEVENSDRSEVQIRLYVDREQKGDWQLILETRDKETAHSKKPLLGAGYAGIRTDFMDVKFKNYHIEELN